jgi:hypothetical protein
MRRIYDRKIPPLKSPVQARPDRYEVEKDLRYVLWTHGLFGTIWDELDRFGCESKPWHPDGT